MKLKVRTARIPINEASEQRIIESWPKTSSSDEELQLLDYRNLRSTLQLPYRLKGRVFWFSLPCRLCLEQFEETINASLYCNISKLIVLHLSIFACIVAFFFFARDDVFFGATTGLLVAGVSFYVVFRRLNALSTAFLRNLIQPKRRET